MGVTSRLCGGPLLPLPCCVVLAATCNGTRQSRHADMYSSNVGRYSSDTGGETRGGRALAYPGGGVMGCGGGIDAGYRLRAAWAAEHPCSDGIVQGWHVVTPFAHNSTHWAIIPCAPWHGCCTRVILPYCLYAMLLLISMLIVENVVEPCSQSVGGASQAVLRTLVLRLAEAAHVAGSRAPLSDRICL